MLLPEISIAGRLIGSAYPPYIVAEMSANHNGSLEKALQTMVAAKVAGADAIKLQTYTPDSMTIDCERSDFQIQGGLWDGYSLYDLYQQAQTPLEWLKPLFDKSRELQLTCFSTPFDDSAVDLLENFNVPAYKIASFEVVDLPLIKKVAETGKPMVISTGMADLQEIEEAVDTARAYGCKELVLLHCISSYPAPIEQSNLRTIVDLSQRFGVVAGLSDHSLGTTASITGVALGAAFIEKHFILSRNDKGPDSSFSIEPTELKQLCEDTSAAWKAIGEAGYKLKPAEEANIKFRRSLYVVKDIQEGELFTKENVRRIRPGYGLKPKFLDKVIGKKASRAIAPGEALAWDMVD